MVGGTLLAILIAVAAIAGVVFAWVLVKTWAYLRQTNRNEKKPRSLSRGRGILGSGFKSGRSKANPWL